MPGFTGIRLFDPGATVSSSVSSLPPASRWRRYRADQQWEGYLFLIPSLAGFLLFVLVPVIVALVLSLYNWTLLSPADFVGIANYLYLLTRDPIFFQVLGNTLYFTVTIVPLQLLAGLLMAVALNQAVRGNAFYRLIYFMPVVTTIVAGALIFQWIFNKDFGIVSAAIWGFNDATGIRVQPPDWLNNPVWAKPAVVILTLWKNVGFTMVIYLAGLQAIPQELYDAAEVDGATSWRRFRYITLPMVSPTTFFLLIIQMIGAFQLFDEAFVMTRGGPALATTTIVYYVYVNAFEYQRFGMASTVAWVLFAFIFAITFTQTRLQSRWVHYETED